ncbi:MAG: YdcF family protein [Firmicutes bacterium]|nr:YdcF family protein [Bacillota bacterium]
MHARLLKKLAGAPWGRISLLVGLFLMGDLLWTFGRFPSYARPWVRTKDRLETQGLPVLILGAGVLSDREPTQVLLGRLQTALDLYRTGQVRWFLVSGDNRSPYYNEPLAMKRWLLKQGVPTERIVADYGGRRTYDSLRRAQVVFGLRRMVIVTSDFHLPRALFSAQQLGIQAWGVPAPVEHLAWYRKLGFWPREYVARHLALLDAWFPPSTLLGPREPTPDDWLTLP